MEPLSFLAEDQVLAIQAQFGTPCFVYDQSTLENHARAVLDFPNAYGLTARYAMKACSNAALLCILHRMGVHIDASSGYEVERALLAGIPAPHIQLTAQQLPGNLKELVGRGVRFNACSLHQLDTYGRLFRGGQLSVRLNPGLGSGHSNRTNVGGPSASFGIWHEQLVQVLELQEQYGLSITGLHTHIGSGSDPQVWQHCARLTLGLASRLPQVDTVSLGGGFKVGRMAGETSTDLQVAGRPVVSEFERFAATHGRQLHLEVEPGTFFAAQTGALICTAVDIVDTGAEGYHFIKVDTGMTEVLRPSLYGAQHPIVLVPASAEERGQKDYLVVGHCCESGDILTPELDNPEGLAPRRLTEAQIGDALFIGGSGAYCASMSAKNYNSFPEAPEVLRANDGSLHLIRRPQQLQQILANEVMPDFLSV